jgi:hypothetical protein
VLIRLERTPQDTILGYDWIEVLGDFKVKFDRNVLGYPRAWITCNVNECYKGKIENCRAAWQDIEDAIESGDYKMTKCEI